MYIKIKKLAEALCANDSPVISSVLQELLQEKDEDIIVISLHEFIASGILTPKSTNAATVSDAILSAEPRRSLLVKFAKRLNHSIPKDEFVRWMDAVLARNIHMEVEEFASQWSKLEDVIAVQQIIRQAPYSGAIEGGCKPISDDRDFATRQQVRRHALRSDPIPSDLLEEGYHYGPNGELLAPSEPDPPVVPEEVDDF